MDSTGLGALLKFYVSAKRRGGVVQLVGVNYRIAEMLELTKADALIKSYPTIEAAERVRSCTIPHFLHADCNRASPTIATTSEEFFRD